MSKLLTIIQYGMFLDEDETPAAKLKRFFGLQSALADKQVFCHVDRLAKTFAKENNKVWIIYQFCFTTE